MIVVDANVIIPLFCASSRTAVAQAVQEHDPEWSVPALWEYEFHNALAKAMRAGLLSLDAALGAAQRAAEALNPNAIDPPFSSVPPLCAKHGITAYDAGPTHLNRTAVRTGGVYAGAVAGLAPGHGCAG